MGALSIWAGTTNYNKSSITTQVIQNYRNHYVLNHASMVMKVYDVNVWEADSHYTCVYSN